MAGPRPIQCGPPPGNPAPQGLEEMTVRTLARKSPKQRVAWYKKKLHAYKAQVLRSAACNGIPSQLVATVVLNELADIDWRDVWQQRLDLGGSLGIAQIQVDTAEANNLVFYPSDFKQIQQRATSVHDICRAISAGRLGGIRSCRSPSQNEKIIKRQMVIRRLATPQFAIEAAAREVRRLLDKACKNNQNPWAKRFSFTLNSMASLKSPKDIYNHIKGKDILEKKLNLSEMVVAAYNSPQILIAQKQASITPGNPKHIYRNGMIHGSNSRFIMKDLHNSKLFEGP